MKCAALQMVSSHDVSDNLAAARRLVDQAARQGAELVVLPEYFCLLGQRDTDKLAVQETLGEGPIQVALADMARASGVWLIGGTLPVATGDDAQRVFNTTLAFDPQGQPIGRYDKIHLFRFARGSESYDESRVLRAGRQPQVLTVTDRAGRDWRVGLSICYDLRFPELYRHAQADIWVVPSAFTFTTGAAHWEVLLRARAIENQAYVIAAAQGGQHSNGRQTWGQSMVIDPWGDILAQHAQGEAVVLATLDAARLAEVRSQLPALTHRVMS
ncbi:MAG: Deaminated glutathione amidase [Paracidovorax wautersii]|uniref:Deaminated glutathione amidase n=1 Tax=Paracidovorax wautersii TaxID=1177982 RepID=A0A7V8JQE0_9BURK|nr:MAG: Deaminated glutathione amidase [Paracidovorax wautersii]